MHQLDLTEEIIGLMNKLQFKYNSIKIVTSDVNFINSLHKAPDEQRVHLVLLINSLFLKANEVVPSKVRLGLTIASDTNSWLADMYTVIFPFLKANEEIFFN